MVGAAGGAGGTFTVAGYDIFGQPMTETITVGAGAVTGWGLKAWKYITSVTPNVTDAHNYSVGTSDVFGLHGRSLIWEDTRVAWDAATMTADTGWVAADTTTPATATTGDVRGTIQTSASGGGSGIGGTASNGSISSLAMSGVRLEIGQFVGTAAMLAATQAAPQSLMGVTQA